MSLFCRGLVLAPVAGAVAVVAVVNDQVFVHELRILNYGLSLLPSPRRDISSVSVVSIVRSNASACLTESSSSRKHKAELPVTMARRVPANQVEAKHQSHERSNDHTRLIRCC